jgi:hypothetical protein
MNKKTLPLKDLFSDRTIEAIVSIVILKLIWNSIVEDIERKYLNEDELLSLFFSNFDYFIKEIKNFYLKNE